MQPQHLKINIQDEISADQLRLKYNKQMSERARYDAENSVSKSTGQAFQKYYIEKYGKWILIYGVGAYLIATYIKSRK